MQKVCAVVLCAGDGKRMKSSRPKVMCEVLFKPMIHWITDALREAGIDDLCLVCSDRSDEVQKAVPGVEIAIQYERRGTGHAVMQARDYLTRRRGGDCVVLCGDAPFLSAEVIERSYRHHKEGGNAMTVITAELADPFGYGRIVRDSRTGLVRGIVEQADTDSATAPIREVNSGAYWFQIDYLLDALGALTTDNRQGEYYLTDTVTYGARRGLPVGGFQADPDVILGANDRAGLLRLNEVARARTLQAALQNGVEVLVSDGVIIGADVTVGPDTRILPGTILRGRVKIGSGCTIGPNTLIENSTVGDNTTVNACQVFDSEIGSSVRLGPFSYVRPGCKIKDNAKIGDFVELKNTVIGERTSVAHLSYLGDAELGQRINMGGGIIICNYDGKHKYRTVIEDDAFVGCNTNLVAPVTVEAGAYVAAGSTITETVPAGSLSIARARQVNKEGWRGDPRGGSRE
ncbi:bifunctional UDP-N-acetylglucosamine diphosphorylase/glucosamine-1-phosphate N-acetyltransferase GlmU [Ligaoa zhengdingensis]|uniref:bifunctional UDP-N-acetylglucosamine diphosphorylase/glucosamine-1-phosphate N-acetyltransferase GlmU n=1 Tax=Ligaoa zhengdingensis TaxID=2763658 RepID=UPI0031BAA1FA